MTDATGSQTEFDSLADARYWAFVSYSHRDEAWAKWLHHGLETYRVPRSLIGRSHADGKIPRRLFPVFRDRDELPGAADLSNEIQQALASSRWLIVICSPNAVRSKYVNEEIRLFKSLGRGRRVLSLIVDGEPNVSERGDLADEECFPPALRFSLGADGAVTDERVEPMAADARAGKDGRQSALLRIISGLLQVRYDELRQRERRRQRARRVRRIGFACLGVLLLALLYVGLADAGINVPGGDGVRRQLDKHGLTLFRPTYDDQEIAESAARMRRRLVRELLSNQHADGIFFDDLQGDQGTVDTWSSTQALSALNRSPEVTSQAAPQLQKAFDQLFSDDLLVRHDGSPVGWRQRIGAPPQGEIAMWQASALSLAARRTDLFAAAQGQRIVAYAQTNAEVLRRHYPTGDGGWNMFADLQDPGRHDIYTSALALQALLNAEEAGAEWSLQGKSRNELLVRTARWLIDGYDSSNSEPGWRRHPTDPKLTTYDGLTLQIYSLLLRAESIANVKIPGVMLRNMTNHLIECGRRDLSFPVTSAEFDNIVIVDGQVRSQNEAVGFLWYPWAMEACVHWLKRAEKVGAAREDIIGVRRTLGHLVVDLADAAIEKYDSGPTFAAAELLYCLASIRGESTSANPK